MGCRPIWFSLLVSGLALSCSTPPPAKIEAAEDLQSPEKLDEVRKRVSAGKHWGFEFDVWDESLGATLGEGLTELQGLVSEVGEFLKKCEAASATWERLEKDRKLLLQEGDAL